MHDLEYNVYLKERFSLTYKIDLYTAVIYRKGNALSTLKFKIHTHKIRTPENYKQIFFIDYFHK